MRKLAVVLAAILALSVVSGSAAFAADYGPIRPSIMSVMSDRP
jgi:hypothetical protein